MITLTIQCSRCGKKISKDMTNRTLNNELIRKFGFNYTHNGRTNVILCNGCEKLYSELKGRLEESARIEMCDFFKYCGEEEENANRRKPEDG